MKEFRVEIRVKNNLLYSAIDHAGFDSVSAFCRAVNLSNTVVGKYINLQEPPLTDRGWKESALRIADALKALPEDLFPADYLREAIKQNKVVREYSAEEVQNVMLFEQATPEELLIQSDALEMLDNAMATLSDREQTVLRMRFGLDGTHEHTLEQVAKAFNMNRERIRQIEQRALRKMKHPARKLTSEILRVVEA